MGKSRKSSRVSRGAVGTEYLDNISELEFLRWQGIECRRTFILTVFAALNYIKIYS